MFQVFFSGGIQGMNASSLTFRLAGLIPMVFIARGSRCLEWTAGI